MGYTNYLKLKDKGDKGELAFANFLSKNGFTNITHIDEEVKKNPNLSLSDWDLKATNELGVEITYEVKNQDECHKWGMFNVEQVQYGKPAGIATSKADVWVFVNEKLGFGVIETSELKKIHWNICKDPTVNKKSYENKESRGEIKLWITTFKNYAAGWRMPNHRLDWKK